MPPLLGPSPEPDMRLLQVNAASVQLIFSGPKDNSSDMTADFVFRASFPSSSLISRMQASGCRQSLRKTWCVPTSLGQIVCELLLKSMLNDSLTTPTQPSSTPHESSSTRESPIPSDISEEM